MPQARGARVVTVAESWGGQSRGGLLAVSLFAALRLPAFFTCWLGHSKLQLPPHLPLWPVQQQLLHGNEVFFLLN